ncbi:MAG TPA: cbb3-type cytochrome c oxidase subunit I [Acidimicrobiales bacterium]|nr:cbb3-type cytochrome c oxidase subunit I [Acidimicrobiales bacterium]
MTSTLTRPPAASPDDVAPVRTPPLTGTWLTTGDHKRLGALFLAGGVIAVAAACASAVVFFLEAQTATFWSAPTSRLASLTTASALVVGVPALWIGLATSVVPLQIGATRLALPRLHTLALWTLAVGAVLTAVGHLAEPDALNSLASSLPAAAVAGEPSPDGTQLIVAGLFVVVLAILLAGISLLATILNRRAEGLRLTYLPLFSWSTLATSTVVVLAAPVLLAGLALLYFDHHYGGQILSAGLGSFRIWAHELWIPGHPFGLLFAAAGVGLLSDVVATHAGRPLVGFPVARVAAAAAPVLTLLLFAGDVSILESPFGSVATIGGIVVGLPLGLALITWLGTLKAGRPKAHPSLLFVLLFLLTVGLATALSVVAVLVGVEGRDADAFRNGQITLLSLALPLLALGGGAVHWSPKLYGRVTPAGLGGIQALLLFAGPVLLAAPGYLIGLGSGDGVVLLGAAGAVVTAVGVLMTLLDLAARGATSEADPYGGTTLEWATASPPPPHNFDELPDIRSAHPLATDPGATA